MEKLDYVLNKLMTYFTDTDRKFGYENDREEILELRRCLKNLIAFTAGIMIGSEVDVERLAKLIKQHSDKKENL
jgi:hypothetical protein